MTETDGKMENRRAYQVGVAVGKASRRAEIDALLARAEKAEAERDTLPALLAAEREKTLLAAHKHTYATYGIAALINPIDVERINAIIDTETEPQPDLPRTSEPQDAHRIANRIASNLFSAGWHEAADYVLSEWMHGQILAALGIEREEET